MSEWQWNTMIFFTLPPSNIKSGVINRSRGLNAKVGTSITLGLARRSRNYHFHRPMSSDGLATVRYVTKVERTSRIAPSARLFLQICTWKETNKWGKFIFRKDECAGRELGIFHEEAEGAIDLIAYRSISPDPTISGITHAFRTTRKICKKKSEERKVGTSRYSWLFIRSLGNWFPGRRSDPRVDLDDGSSPRRSIWLTCGNPIGPPENRSPPCGRSPPGFRRVCGRADGDDRRGIPGRRSRPGDTAKISRQTTWRNERTKEVQERVTWTSHGVGSYTLPAPIWRHGRVSYQLGGPTPVKPTPVGGELKRRRKHAQLVRRRRRWGRRQWRRRRWWWWRKCSWGASSQQIAQVHPVLHIPVILAA